MTCEDCIIDTDDRQLARTFEDFGFLHVWKFATNICTGFFYRYVIGQAKTKY